MSQRWWYIESLARFGVKEVVYAEDSKEAFREARRRTGFAGQLMSYTMDEPFCSASASAQS